MGGIINKRKLAKLRREIDALRAAKHNIRPGDLISVAESLGRREVKRGKHPTYVNDLVPTRNPLSIPSHATLKAPTAISVLDELEVDLEMLSELLDEQEKKANEQAKKLPQATIRTDVDA